MNTNQEVKQKKQLSKLEKSWIAYDIGNSAFVLLVTTMLPLFFNALAESAGVAAHNALAYWGYTQSVVTLIVIFLGPILGAVADSTGNKKKMFVITVIFGIMTLMALALPLSWFTFLVFIVIARVGFQASLIFYDAMLPDVTTDENMDTISTFGYAFGYIGSVIPFVLSLVFVLGADKIGISAKMAMSIAILINAIWWFIFTIPLINNYQQPIYNSYAGAQVKNVFIRIGHTLTEIIQAKRIF